MTFSFYLLLFYISIFYASFFLLLQTFFIFPPFVSIHKFSEFFMVHAVVLPVFFFTFILFPCAFIFLDSMFFLLPIHVRQTTSFRSFNLPFLIFFLRVLLKKMPDDLSFEGALTFMFLLSSYLYMASHRNLITEISL